MIYMIWRHASIARAELVGVAAAITAARHQVDRDLGVRALHGNGALLVRNELLAYVELAMSAGAAIDHLTAKSHLLRLADQLD